MADTIFGKIARGELEVEKLYEDEFVVAFPDISPQAPTHILVIPRQPVADITEADEQTVAAVMCVASELGQKFCPDGFRLVTNKGEQAGQSVFHWHVHVLGGRELTWPPG